MPADRTGLSGNDFGQTLAEIKKRREGDSNPRSGYPDTAFPVLHNRPLCHLSRHSNIGHCLRSITVSIAGISIIFGFHADTNRFCRGAMARKADGELRIKLQRFRRFVFLLSSGPLQTRVLQLLQQPSGVVGADDNLH